MYFCTTIYKNNIDNETHKTRDNPADSTAAYHCLTSISTMHYRQPSLFHGFRLPDTLHYIYRPIRRVATLLAQHIPVCQQQLPKPHT